MHFIGMGIGLGIGFLIVVVVLIHLRTIVALLMFAALIAVVIGLLFSLSVEAYLVLGCIGMVAYAVYRDQLRRLANRDRMARNEYYKRVVLPEELRDMEILVWKHKNGEV